ncbi:hypothetical protein BC567DRAFT_278423 [Phyllosticta citribraziliensis]
MATVMQTTHLHHRSFHRAAPVTMEPNGNPCSTVPIQPLVHPEELNHPWFVEYEAAWEANDLQRVDCLCRAAVEDRRASLTARFRASVTLAGLTSGGEPWEHYKRAHVCAAILQHAAMTSPDAYSRHLEVNIDGVHAMFGILKVLEHNIKELDKCNQRDWLQNVASKLLGPQQGEAAEQPQAMVQEEPSAAAAAAADAMAEIAANTTAPDSPPPDPTIDRPWTKREIAKGLEMVKAWNATH